jgi:plasmid stabilization system protein ParE
LKIKLSTPAREDVAGRAAYLLERNRAAAIAFLDELDEALAFLAQNPLAGRSVELHGLRRPVRAWPPPPMMIYYAPQGDALQIYRVRHSARRPITR